MWSVEYVQVPDETRISVPSIPTTKSSNRTDDATDSTASANSGSSIPVDIAHQGSRNTYSEEVQNAVERLKNFKDPDNITSKLVELGSSVDSNCHFMSQVREKLEGLDNSGRESIGAIDTEGTMGNLSGSSSISDLCHADDVCNVDGEMNKDGEVQSVHSTTSLSIDTAVEAIEGENGNQDDIGTNVNICFITSCAKIVP